MKNLFLPVILCFIGNLSFSQSQKADSWKILWNKKVILEANKENETANIKKISKSDLTKNCFLEISYKESDPRNVKAFIRSFLFFDETDKQILKKDSTRNVKISAKKLKNLFGDKKRIKIYTIAIPSDPEMAARVRVRRVHLCTLETQ